MDNVFEFKKKTPVVSQRPSELVVSSHIYQTPEGEFEVEMDIGDADDETVFEALLAVAMHFATSHGLTEDELEIEPEGPANDG